jgi:hypothetical protein
MVDEDMNAKHKPRKGKAQKADAEVLNITPKMVQAGIRVLADEAGVCSIYVAEELAPEIFQVMWAARIEKGG